MRTLILALAASAAAAASAPAFAQTVEELTVMGQWNGRGEPPASLSRVVSYADLDLRYPGDQQALRQRVRDAARDVCDDLGRDQPDHTNLGHSCMDEAMRGAQDQMRVAIADAFNRPPAYALAVPPPVAYVAPAGPTAPSADRYSAETSATVAATAEPTVTTTTVTNGPVPDTAANRGRLGEPMSNAGQRTVPAGN